MITHKFESLEEFLTDLALCAEQLNTVKGLAFFRDDFDAAFKYDGMRACCLSVIEILEDMKERGVL